MHTTRENNNDSPMYVHIDEAPSFSTNDIQYCPTKPGLRMPDISPSVSPWEPDCLNTGRTEQRLK